MNDTPATFKWEKNDLRDRVKAAAQAEGVDFSTFVRNSLEEYCEFLKQLEPAKAAVRAMRLENAKAKLLENEKTASKETADNPSVHLQFPHKPANSTKGKPSPQKPRGAAPAKKPSDSR